MIKYDLKLKGYVGDWDFDPDYVDWFLNKNKDRQVTILIDSLGGSLFSGMSVAAAMKTHGNVHVHYVGFNASAATLASMNAKHISIDPHAMYLVHKVSQFVCKVANCNADEMAGLISSLEKSRRDLEKFDLCIAGMYAARCKKPKEDLLKLMAEGGWLSAQEAKDWGFVDEISDTPDAKPTTINDTVLASMTEAGIPTPPGFGNKKPGFFQRIADAVAAVFPSIPSNIINKMEKSFLNLCRILAVDSLTFVNGKADLSEDQADTLENHLAQSAQKISDLEAKVEEQRTRIENLINQPAEQSAPVINEGSNSDADDAMDEFSAIAQRAKDLFNAIH